MSATDLQRAVARPIPLVPRLIFATRRLQLPLYIGLILAQALIAQTVIHITFLLSAMAVASTDRLMGGAGHAAKEHA